MKLEKREVTLNEKDTLKDALTFERTLLTEYAAFACVVTGEERRAQLIARMEKILRVVFTLVDLLQSDREGMKE